MTLKINAATRLMATNAMDSMLTKAQGCVATEVPFDCPPKWLIMNASRPLVGTQTAEGKFLAGTHYAAIDPNDSTAISYVKKNLADGAVVVILVDRVKRDKMAWKTLDPSYLNMYKEDYAEMNSTEKQNFMNSLYEDLHCKAYVKLLQLSK